MGLGKTLSILALIAWYLDSLALDTIAPRTTLVVTTTSSEYFVLLCGCTSLTCYKLSRDGSNKSRGKEAWLERLVNRRLKQTLGIFSRDRSK